MRTVFFLLLFNISLSSTGQAALATNADSAVSFYRSQNSLFPSGQVSRAELESKLLQTETEVVFRSGWDGKEFSLQADQILRDIHVARTVETTQATSLWALNSHDSLKLKSLPTKAELEVLSVEDFWAQVKEVQGKLRGWVPLHHLQSTYQDAGVFTNLIDTYIRKTPASNGLVLTTLPRLRRVQPLEIGKHFLKISYENQVGYVDISHFVSRADFATLVYHPRKNWVPVRHRLNDNLITQTGEAIPVKDILGYVTTPRRGIMKKADPQYGPPLRAHVEIKKLEAHVWGLSDLKGHGRVWWKRTDLLVNSPKNNLAATLTTEDLLKREIYSIAFEQKNSIRGIVSSGGIFLTEDGQTWTHIPQFGKNNFPVSIHPNGTWFVGAFKSTNKGKSFEPFIRWDKIAKAIEMTYHRNPRIMKLTRIEPLPNSRVQIHVDTGSRKFKLRSLIGDLTWDVVTN